MTDRLLKEGLLDRDCVTDTGDLVFDLVRILENARFDKTSDREHAKKSIAKVSALFGLELLPSAPGSCEPNKSCGLAPWQVVRLQEVIDSRIDQKVSVTELSRLVRLSSSHFARAFKIAFGETPHQYIVRRRVAHAKRLLVSTAMPLHEIALNCGFSDQAHLCRIFRRIVGGTPSAWRRHRQNVISSAYENFPANAP